MSKLLSTCCKAKAKVNRIAGGFFCDKCGQDCSASEEKTGFAVRSTLSTVRKPTGEMEVFLRVYVRARFKSEVSGEPLLPPEHPRFHHQFHHLLEKGTYPDYQTDDRNIVACTGDEHDFYHSTPKGILMAHPQWGKWMRLRATLKTEAYAKGKVVDPIQESDNDAAQLLLT